MWTEAACEHCGKTYAGYRSRIKRFCSYACYHASLRKLETRSCSRCGADVTRAPSAFKGKSNVVFCDRACRGRYYARLAKRPRFRSSIGDHHREVYGDACSLCGWSRCVEYCHIIPAKDGGTIHPDNIVVLCPNHHTLFDRGLLSEDETQQLAERVAVASSSEYARILVG
jgi:hypothetical protein